MKLAQQDLFGDVAGLSSSEKLSTNLLSRKYRVQRWANFIAGYSVEFVENCLNDFHPANDIVFDPFLGCGTTLLAARNLGFEGIGIERHPVFHCMSVAKLSTYRIEDLEDARRALLQNEIGMDWSDDAEKFLVKMFTSLELAKIRKASAGVRMVRDSIQPLTVSLFLKSCEYACGSQTDGIYKAPTSKKKSLPFEEALEKSYRMFSNDIQSQWYQNEWSNKPNGLCVSGSSLTEIPKVLESGSIAACITSPPYLNNFDYAEMTRMQLYLLGWAGSWRNISETVRNNLITNTTTALKGKKSEQYQDQCRSEIPNRLLAELDEIVAELEVEKKVRPGKKEYCYLVYPYYSQMQKILTDIHDALRTDGQLHWVVADAALYGIHVKTHLHTAEMLRAIGYKDVEVHFLRRRGHRWVLSKRDGAKEGLGEYHLSARK